jgi:5'/3'-nucleotidase SurE
MSCLFNSNFATSSGTIGAALEAALCGVRAVALSFAYFQDDPYTAADLAAASRVACRILRTLWATWPAGVQLFNVNVPLHAGVEDAMPVHLTHVHSNSSGPLFRPDDAALWRFRFAPDFGRLMPPRATHGSDNWAVHARVASVTPLRAAYAEVPWPSAPFPPAPAPADAADVDVALEL